MLGIMYGITFILHVLLPPDTLRTELQQFEFLINLK